MTRMIICVLCTYWVAPSLFAQETSAYRIPEEYREVQVRQLETQRRLLLAMADSMPEHLYRDRATPGQRDFAGQVHHAANGVLVIARRILNRVPPVDADTTIVFNQAAAMKSFIDDVYNWAIAEVRAQSAADRNAMVEGPGRTMPRWQLWDEIHHHTIWTAGQIVANFRKHAMAPPGFSFF